MSILSKLCYLQKPHVSGRYTKAFCPGVFCPVGISVQEGTLSSGGHCPGGLYLGRGSLLRRPPHGNKQAVRILVEYILVTFRNEVAKVMFLQVCVCPWGGLPQCMLRYRPEQAPPPRDQGGLPQCMQAPPRSRHSPEQAPPSAGTPLEQAPPWDQTPPDKTPPADSYCCGWYASYWNAFLLHIISVMDKNPMVLCLLKIKPSA